MTESGGLRERKKARTRAAIQEHALRLFAEQGYHETTTEQIAAAAEISPSTLFRYFATKEDTVLYDSLDVEVAAAIVAQPADVPPVEAVRRAMHQVLESLTPDATGLETTRQRLIFSVPELRGRTYQQVSGAIQALAEAMATRLGRKPEDIRVRMWAGAVLGTIMATFGEEYHDAPEFGQASFLPMIDQALDFVEGGLNL